MNTKASPVEWVGRLIDQRFPLFEWLGSAESGQLFRTELPGPAIQKAAIRLVPADIEGAQAQFDDWAQAEGLSHPNLLRIFESGRGRIDENEFLYVVTELPEETLAQLLPTRTLTGPEAGEMLPPIVDALEYLHARGLVHGHITPANVLVVGDRVKLSADTLQQSGQLRKLQGGLRAYDAPEVGQGTISPASDVWSLGITLVEALTQLPPMRNSRTGEPGVPQFMPEPFAEIARQSLRVDPASRASLAEILAALRIPQNRTAAVPPTAPVASAPAVPARSASARDMPLAASRPVPVPVSETASGPVSGSVSGFESGPAASQPPTAPQATSAPPQPRPPQPASAPPARLDQGQLAFDEIQPSRRALRSVDDEADSPRPKISTPFIVGLAALLVVLIAALFLRSHRAQPAPQPESSTAAPNAPAPPSQPAPAHPTAPSHLPNAKGAVAERVMPQIPERADRTIRGKITVRVRLAVDREGNVSNASLESAGSSRYFANLALQAARKWRFKAPHADGRPQPSAWILRFDFRRGKIEVNPAEVNP